MHQSNPGVRLRRLSQPSIHLPRSVYLPSIKIGSLAFSKCSFGAKKSSFATSTAPPTFSEARSISSVKSIRESCVPPEDRRPRHHIFFCRKEKSFPQHPSDAHLDKA